MSRIRTGLQTRATVALSVFAASFFFLVMTPSQLPAAGLLIADGGFGGVLDMKQQDVHVTINNGIAVTEVTQVFHNTENRIVEALYTFPVPEGASVANFSMWIGGKEMVGEVVEKERARQIFESYKQTRRDPGLLEQVDYKRLEMRIFPIPAGADQRVKVEYYQELNFDHDWATYVYPLATVTRSDLKQRTTGSFSFNLEIKTEVPLVEVVSPSHGDDVVIVKQTANLCQASYEVNQGDLSRDIVVTYHLQRPHTGFDLVTSRSGNGDGYFLLTLTLGQELEATNPGMDYVFVVDTSGSMADDGKLRLSRECIAAFINELSPEDRLEVLVFNISPTALFQQLTAVDEASIQQALDFLSSQRARGGTILRPAVQRAYKYKQTDRALNVVVLSDGMTEVAEQAELLRLINESPSGARVFCVGVGNEVNRPLLSQLADSAGGLAAFISHGANFEHQAEAFRRKLTRPAGTNLNIAIDDVGAYDITPAQLPNLYHGAPLRIYGRYKSPGSALVTLQGDVLGAPLEQSVTVEMPKTVDANPEIERMWAYQQVNHLLRRARAGNDDLKSSPLIKDVIRLCERYSIVSEYASFIVLENDSEYRRWKIERRNVDRIERDRAARQRLRAQLSALRERALDALGPAVERTSDVAPVELTSAPDPLPEVVPVTPSPGRNIDIAVGSGVGGGGGAIDPLTGLVAAGMAGAAAFSARRRRRQKRAADHNA